MCESLQLCDRGPKQRSPTSNSKVSPLSPRCLKTFVLTNTYTGASNYRGKGKLVLKSYSLDSLNVFLQPWSLCFLVFFYYYFC